MHADVAAGVKQALQTGGPEAAMRAALYPSLFLLAWHEISPSLAELLSLPLRFALAKELKELGVCGNLDLKKALREAVKRAAGEGIGFSVDKLKLGEPLAFAVSFAKALKQLKWAQPKKPRGVLIERRPMPVGVATFAEDRGSKKFPHARAFNQELRSDHAILLQRGLKVLSLDGSDAPEAIAEAVHALVAAVQKGKRRLSSNQAAGIAVVWGDQLVRGLAWQWAEVVHHGETPMAGLVSPDRALSHFPMPFLTRQAKTGGTQNTFALLFNMLRDGNTPPAKPGSLTPVG
jgi:hypothetical protein